ncbi:hypothetical protein HaLaN_22224 [Haematococcus lacustris]|uniref:Uncharacterized protein n=1 Tax=Haematococcus lacustris TaxID=44745 RepID=A0A699ZXR3_HAELA|nr:hypothetical protein HaLaN_22224 [Haematococcus lacustris]
MRSTTSGRTNTPTCFLTRCVGILRTWQALQRTTLALLEQAGKACSYPLMQSRGVSDVPAWHALPTTSVQHAKGKVQGNTHASPPRSGFPAGVAH